MHRLIVFGSRLLNFDTRSILKHFLNFYPMLGRCVGVWVCGCRVWVCLGAPQDQKSTNRASSCNLARETCQAIETRNVWVRLSVFGCAWGVFGCVRGAFGCVCGGLGVSKACLGVSGARLGLSGACLGVSGACLGVSGTRLGMSGSAPGPKKHESCFLMQSGT